MLDGKKETLLRFGGKKKKEKEKKKAQQVPQFLWVREEI